MQSLAEIVDSIDSVVCEAYLTPTTSIDPATAADAAVVAAGYSPIGQNWRELSSEGIADELAFRIGHDLAYSVRLVPEGQCKALSTALMSHAHKDARWLTNVGPGHHSADCSSGYSWAPISDWTFDAAFVAVGPEKTLLICFFAED